MRLILRNLCADSAGAEKGAAGRHRDRGWAHSPPSKAGSRRGKELTSEDAWSRPGFIAHIHPHKSYDASTAAQIRARNAEEPFRVEEAKRSFQSHEWLDAP